jgi:hypothetical protein
VPRSSKIHPNSAAARARCEGDGCSKQGAGVLMRMKIDERFKTHRARLCQRCAKAGGWVLGADLPLLTH